MPLISAARTPCKNAFGRTGVANREHSLHLSPVSSLTSVSPSEISRVSPRLAQPLVSLSNPMPESGLLRLNPTKSRQNNRSLERPIRPLGRTPIF